MDRLSTLTEVVSFYVTLRGAAMVVVLAENRLRENGKVTSGNGKKSVQIRAKSCKTTKKVTCTPRCKDMSFWKMFP